MKLKNTFSTKLLVTNTVILAFCTASILIYFYHFLRDKEVSYVEQTLQTLHIKTVDQVDSLVDSLDQTAIQIAATPYVFSTFNQLPKINHINYFANDSFLRVEMRDFLIPYILKNQFVTRICLYTNMHDFIDIGYKYTDSGPINIFFHSKAFKDITTFFENNSKTGLFIPPQQDPFSSKSAYTTPIQLLSVIRPIKNYTAMDDNVIGYVEVQIDYTILDKIFSSLDEDTVSLILDKKGQIIYPLGDQLADVNLEDLDMNNYLYTTSSFENIDYDLVLLKNKASLLGQYTTLQNMVIAIFLFAFSIVGGLQILIFLYFIKPLKQLQHSVESISIDNLSFQLFDDTSSDEFTQLNDAFHTMFTQLRESIDHTILAKTSLSRAHLLALQAQVDPHFIHNVLSVMAATAEEYDVPKIEQMCTKLASMLRFSSSYKHTTVCLADEIAYTEAYLDLMKERYEDLFYYAIHIDPAQGTLMVPKLILQPLAENCFQHGFKQKPSPWYIEIDSFIDKANGRWFLTVSDNGIGFSDTFIQDFVAKQQEMDWGTTDEELTKLEIGGLCLSNLFLRLKLLYKEDFIFTVRNNELGGATICIGGTIDDYAHTDSGR